MHYGNLPDWIAIALLTVNAVLVWRYLRETRKIRIASEEQVEAQMMPAVVIHPHSRDYQIALINVGKGPALHIKLSATERGSAGKRELDRMDDDIVFLLPGEQPLPTSIRTQGAGLNVLSGRSLQCEYTSLSGRTYWTVIDFNKVDNGRLLATRFYSDPRRTNRA
jgi:hypothetical protein